VKIDNNCLAACSKLSVLSVAKTAAIAWGICIVSRDLIENPAGHSTTVSGILVIGECTCNTFPLSFPTIYTLENPQRFGEYDRVCAFII